MATHFSIVPADGAMTVDGKGMGGIDFSSADIPADINALQWEDGQGELEYLDARNNPNVILTEVPEWAEKCLVLFAEAVQNAIIEEGPTNELPVGARVQDEPGDFWGQYPEANAATVDQILAKEYPGIVNSAAQDPNLVLKGVLTTDVQDGATALTSLRNLRNDCLALGVTAFSDPLNDDVSDSFIEYMTGLGYVLASNRQLFYPWNDTLEKRRADININVGRSVTLQEGVGWNGDNWQIDLISRNNILGVVTAINAGLWDSETVTWRNTANEDKQLTVAEFKELAKAVIEKVNQVYLDSFAAKG
jgi:hypothetical protein